MALTLVLTGIIQTVDDLRRIIGGPTLDTADPGYVSDEMLEEIIQRHHDDAVKLAEKVVGTLVDKGQEPGPPILFEPVAIPVAASTDQPGLLEGDIPVGYYPWARQVEDDQGRGLIHDNDITRTVRTAFVPRYVFRIVGMKIYTNPEISSEGAITTVNAHLAPSEDLFDYVIDGEVMEKVNAAIIAEAEGMLAARIKEGMRLEQVYGSNDGVVGDMS